MVPGASSDLFNYLGYARLGGLHGLNPYQHVIGQEFHDPVYTFTTWRHLHSPYGPLFTAGTYVLGRLPLPVAYWLLKVITVAASLGVVALVWWCARRLGRDAKLAVAFVALNPIYLVYAVGGFHNDFFMLLPALGAIALLLSGHERASCAYQIRNGLHAHSAATRIPHRRETSFAPAPKATGTVSRPARADSDRSPASPYPNSRAHTQATQ